MFLITRVEIDGFWGNYKIETELQPDVNIFIGKNGSGKTTFINMLYSVLKVDLRSLLLLEFNKITITLVADENLKTKTISVTKSETPETTIQTLTYKLTNKNYKFEISPREIDLLTRNLRRRSMIGDSVIELEKKIAELINISSLTVSRMASDYVITEEEYRTGRRLEYAVMHPIDQRLEDLMQRLRGYQLTLAKEANEISSKLQRDVLLSMLYNPQFDKFQTEDINLELSKEKGDLSKAYQELGALDDIARKKIDEHINALNKSLSNIRKAQSSEKTPLRVDDVMPISLLKRTQHIIDLSLKAEQQKQVVFQLIDLFTKTFTEFVEDKNIFITPSGDLQILKGNKIIQLSNISSGEKQLLILLTETLLQKNTPFIFLADEPELSLHIEWQAKIISSIKKLNSSAQVIVATHSPEIAAGWKDNLISMEDILHE